MMENLKKLYPNLFKRKEIIVVPKQRNITKWHLNEPIIKEYDTHYEVRKLKDSSPMILGKNFVL